MKIRIFLCAGIHVICSYSHAIISQHTWQRYVALVQQLPPGQQLTPAAIKTIDDLIADLRQEGDAEQEIALLQARLAGPARTTGKRPATPTSPREERAPKRQQIDREKVDEALWYAAAHNNAQQVQLLLAAGADVNYRHQLREGSDEWVPPLLVLFFENQNSDPKIVQQLIAAGADVNYRDNDGENALVVYLRGQMDPTLDIVQQLIIAGVDVNAKDNKGNTAIMFTSDIKICTYLIAVGVDVNAQDKDGTTALMYAALSDEYDIVEALVAAGADISLRSNDNKRARDYAGNSDDYNRAVSAGLAEQQAYRARQAHAKKMIEQEKQLVPAISNIITGYAHGPSPIDLPEQEEEKKKS